MLLIKFYLKINHYLMFSRKLSGLFALVSAVDARERAAQAAVVGIEYGGGFRHDHRSASTRRAGSRIKAMRPKRAEPSRIGRCE